jgi:hypothetical protein
MQKEQTIDKMHKAGARCAGCSDGDTQQPHCFFYFSCLLLFFFYLFFKAWLLKSFFKTLLLNSSFLLLKVSFLRLALFHVSFTLS